MVYWCMIMDVLGIVGEYIGKIYLETKERPRFIIEKILKQIISEMKKELIYNILIKIIAIIFFILMTINSLLVFTKNSSVS